ncbi:tigger transposable element-derived 1-like [Pelobates cultripes]|uniref:Tigger transposable element-derived 1-like n=1 Tax=Pelobates cultripes TaxID=61616 RepID=A0AAD1TK91_PELCU|nr:tigger transposable element-derived 1-like [Pelobates cultripes]
MKEKITGRDAAKGVTTVSKQRPPVLEEVETLILLWIEQKQRAVDSVTKAIICEKAKALHADLLKQQPGTSRLQGQQGVVRKVQDQIWHPQCGQAWRGFKFRCCCS